MVTGMEMPVESDARRGMRGAASLCLRLLGPLTVSRDGVAVALPASRKVRALLAYLALAPGPVFRSRLCELLWDAPNDSRGELRWCLSKLRTVVDEPGRRRIETQSDTVRLDLADCFVDAAEIAGAIQQGVETIPPDRLRGLSALFAGGFLDGFEIDRNPAFSAWLIGQRRRFRGCHTAVLERLAMAASGPELLGYLEKWLELAPFDLRVHSMLLHAFARRGRVREGEEHLDTMARLFEAEGLDFAPLRDLWRDVRARGEGGAQSGAFAAPLTQTETLPIEAAPISSRRASIAVMPFTGHGGANADWGGPASGLTHDLITRLAKLRSLFVIAQGSVFALSGRRAGPDEAGRMLNVDYVVSGSLRRQGKRLTVSVELTETRTARIVWAEVFDHTVDDVFLVLDEIGNRIVASVAHEIETIERNRAVLKPPNSLDAWEAYHRGLWHMYRFSKADNDHAHHFFETAVRLDPTFSRAYAGLSFTHFQNAFQGWTPREPEIGRAIDMAGQSLMADERDPAAHWAMGRALWLCGNHTQSLAELETAIDLSPNFALGHYTLAFVHSQAGDPQAAVRASDQSRHLSPFDPMLFGMLGARAMAMVRLGQLGEAADWGVRAAARPNAHAHIQAIAAYSLALAGRIDEARAHRAAIYKTQPTYRIDDFLAAMQFAPDAAALFIEGARRIG